jgi:hypothetical protein
LAWLRTRRLHRGQTTDSRCPQLKQKLASSVFVVWHTGQIITPILLIVTYLFIEPILKQLIPSSRLPLYEIDDDHNQHREKSEGNGGNSGAVENLFGGGPKSPWKISIIVIVHIEDKDVGGHAKGRNGHKEANIISHSIPEKIQGNACQQYEKPGNGDRQHVGFKNVWIH